MGTVKLTAKECSLPAPREFRWSVSAIMFYTLLNSCRVWRHDAVAVGLEGGVIEGAESSIMHPSHHPLQSISKSFKKCITHFLLLKLWWTWSTKRSKCWWLSLRSSRWIIKTSEVISLRSVQLHKASKQSELDYEQNISVLKFCSSLHEWTHCYCINFSWAWDVGSWLLDCWKSGFESRCMFAFVLKRCVDLLVNLKV